MNPWHQDEAQTVSIETTHAEWLARLSMIFTIYTLRYTNLRNRVLH